MKKTIHTLKYKHFCKLMLAARESAGLSQLELAARLTKPQSFVSKYENGERRLDVVEFLNVCQALMIEPTEIIQTLQIEGD